MSVFCLLHSSGQGPSGWDLLVPELASRGHIAITPDLPVDEPDASATSYAQVAVDSLKDVDGAVIVVAHSASGMFLPVAASMRPVRHMVFLAAVVPKLGTSIREQFKQDPSMFNPEWLGVDPIKDDEIAMKFLFHDCSPEIAKWALTTRRMMYARAAIEEVCPLQQWPDVPSSYIVCAEDRTITPGWSRRVAKERLGVDAIELPGGHCPNLSRPRELAHVLDRISKIAHGG